MIQVSSLSKAYGERILFKDVCWQISKGDRVGLCGANGAGKTTLLRILAGLEPADSGTVVRPNALTIGYLPQDGIVHSGHTVIEEARKAFAPLLEMSARMRELEELLADTTLPQDEHEGALVEYSELQERFGHQDGYSIDLKVATILRGLGFKASDFESATDGLSGGWQMRLALAKLLLGRPRLLLLDEPTNHLDIEARNWLESYLAVYPHSVVMISHDRYFLDTVVTRITEVGLQTLTDFKGTYSEYLVEREARIERLLDARQRQDEEVARIKQFIDRFRYQATRAAQVQSRIKMLEKIEPIIVPPVRKKVHFSFPPCERSGRMALELQDVTKAYGRNVVFGGTSVQIERGERVALVGPNGAGKSTMMRLLAGVEVPDAGRRIEGHKVVMQYFAQDEASRLDPDITVYETLAIDSPSNMVPEIRNILGGFLFSGDDAFKQAGVLSGGERTRLAVARMLLRPSNTMLLDEPTNHLDMDSKEVLLDALVDYGGTLVFVSHDRYFLDKLATRVIEIGNGAATLYPGTYEEFVYSKAQREAAAAGAEPLTQRARPASNTWEERKRAVADARKKEKSLKQLKERIAGLERAVAEREQEIRDIETSMAAPQFYDDRDAAHKQIQRHKELAGEVDQLMSNWETANEELEEMARGA